MKASLTRVSSPTASSSSRQQTSADRSSAGLGSISTTTATTGGGGGGGGGDHGDYSLILQTVVKPGSRVKKGEVVAEMDRQYMLLRLDDYRANVDQVESSMRILKTNLDVDRKAQQQSILAAKGTLDKARLDLKTIPVQAEIDAEKLRLNEQEAAAQYKALLSEVKFKEVSRGADWNIADLEYRESKVELQRAEQNAERMIFRAPINGITVMTSIYRSGDWGQIQAGDEIHPGQVFMRVVDTDSMVVNATVNQADVEKMRLGMPARVRFDAYPDLELPAHVYSIGAMPGTGGFRAEFVKYVPVVLKLDKLDPRVIPDLTVSADVLLERADGGMMAPRESIFTDRSGKPYVMLQAGDGWTRQDVELGPMNNVAAVVREGLRPGQVIAAEWPEKANGGKK